MDERQVRLECLRLALTTQPTHVDPPIERAKKYTEFVLGEPEPKESENAPRKRARPKDSRESPAADAA